MSQSILRGRRARSLTDALSRTCRSFRAFATLTEEGHAAEIFDRESKKAQRDRAAFLRSNDEDHVILGAMAERLLDRLEDCKREFPTAVILGGAGESVLRRLTNGRAGIKTVHHLDASQAMLNRTSWLQKVDEGTGNAWPKIYNAVADEEFLPLKYGSVDVIISCLGLHWVNDVPGAMTQCRKALKPDGLFLACMWGGETLQELRIACHLAEEEAEGGVSQRVSPLAQVRDAGNLLTRAGLTIPSVDVDEVLVNHETLDNLVHHLRLMGESNAVRTREPRFKKATWEATKAAYQSLLSEDERDSGFLPATFQAIYMTGWAPHERQQQPMERGSATVSFKDLEKELGSKTPEQP